ncbi:amidohydrolase family protein [Sphingomonas sp.]|uniref:amidohydrolase family protein n=1 Tax=Sphingomonas sp. TaxID=28214 RepID=UPI002C9BACB2|nr:amidohydrolase family protein [Sphingomonas sp.]HWK35434.1 amidohydrolase family protein [Sphingomonas sp.]
MIIDAHAHLLPVPEIFSYRSMLQASNGNQGYNTRNAISEDVIAKAATRNVALMDEVGTDVQMLSPRPFMLMHSNPNWRDVVAYAEVNNDCIAQTVKLYPDRFRGVGCLPQTPHQPIEFVFDELDRIIDDLGFAGVMINPDPGEGTGAVPNFGDPYWYPLWERLIEKDVPVHVHSAGCCGRENYDEHFASEESLAITSMARERVFERYPGLKMMISHGGGAVPYQFGRWQAFMDRRSKTYVKNGYPAYEPFLHTLKRFWFDTCIHYQPSLELLFGLVGPERCMFGTERPGSASSLDPATGRDLDDLKPVIESMACIDHAGKQAVFEGNARSFFSRANL